MIMRRTNTYNLILLGGGLASGLLAYRLKKVNPSLKVAIIERNPRLGGNHTWSFHTTDVSPDALIWLHPFIARSWNHHEVKFPNYSKKIHSGYHSIRSEDFHHNLQSTLGKDLYLNETVDVISPTRIQSKSGEVWEAPCILDGRGFEKYLEKTGFQKFLGIDVELKEPHGLEGPILMDATCDQTDGFRFFYVLPWDSHCCLIEDTRYTLTANLNRNAYRNEIFTYAQKSGWEIVREVREEMAVLPIPLSRDFCPVPSPLTFGTRGMFFHPTTGYSLPDAVRLTEYLIRLDDWKVDSVKKLFETYRRQQHSQWSFLLLLNRMLFLAAEPQERYQILERFYTLKESTIKRFYSLELTYLDRIRILMGKPPVSLVKVITSQWRYANA